MLSSTFERLRKQWARPWLNAGDLSDDAMNKRIGRFLQRFPPYETSLDQEIEALLLIFRTRGVSEENCQHARRLLLEREFIALGDEDAGKPASVIYEERGMLGICHVCKQEKAVCRKGRSLICESSECEAALRMVPE